MKGKRIDSAGKRLGRFAKFRVNAAKTFFVKKDAPTIRRVAQAIPLSPGGACMPLHDRLMHPVLGCPVLFENSLAFLFSHFNQMLSAATTTIVTAPVLKYGQFQSRASHESLSKVQGLLC